MNAIIIEVKGGCVINTISDSPIEIHLVDHDNIQEGGSVEYGLPDEVLPPEEFLEKIKGL